MTVRSTGIDIIFHDISCDSDARFAGGLWRSPSHPGSQLGRGTNNFRQGWNPDSRRYPSNYIVSYCYVA